MQTVMRDFFFFFFGSFSFLRFFRRIFSNFKKISTLSERERERFLVRRRRKSSLHFTPPRALSFVTPHKKHASKKREREKGNETRTAAMSPTPLPSPREYVYIVGCICFFPRIFFLNRSPQSFNFLATDPGVPLCARANRNGNTGVSIEGEDLTQTIAFQTPGGPRVPLHSVVVRSSSKLNFFFAFTSDFSNFEPPPPFVNTLVVSIPSFVGVKFQN